MNCIKQHQPTLISVPDMLKKLYSRHEPEQLPKKNKNENTDWLMHDITGLK